MGTKRANESRTVAAWEQTSMLPSEAVEVTCKVGFVGESGVFLFQLEARRQPGNSLVAMQSWPGVPHSGVDLVAEAVVAEMIRLARDLVDPF